VSHGDGLMQNKGAGLDGASVHGWTGLDKSGIWKLIEWDEFMRARMADDAGVGFDELWHS